MQEPNNLGLGLALNRAQRPGPGNGVQAETETPRITTMCTCAKHKYLAKAERPGGAGTGPLNGVPRVYDNAVHVSKYQGTCRGRGFGRSDQTSLMDQLLLLIPDGTE